MRGLALQVKKNSGLRVFHETIRMFLKNTIILQELLGKRPCCQHKM